MRRIYKKNCIIFINFLIKCINSSLIAVCVLYECAITIKHLNTLRSLNTTNMSVNASLCEIVSNITQYLGWTQA